MAPAPAILEARPHLERYAHFLTGNATEADDLVQDTLCRGLAKAHLFRPGTNLVGWLMTLMKHRHIDICRSRRRWGPLADIAVCTDELAVPAINDAPLLRRDIARAIERLSPLYRVPLLLVAADGLSYQEVADRLGIPLNTVRSRLMHARETLRAELGGAA